MPAIWRVVLSEAIKLEHPKSLSVFGNLAHTIPAWLICKVSPVLSYSEAEEDKKSTWSKQMLEGSRGHCRVWMIAWLSQNLCKHSKEFTSLLLQCFHTMSGNTAHKEFAHGQSFFRDFISVCGGFHKVLVWCISVSGRIRFRNLLD